MNKTVIIGIVSSAVVVFFCGIGGAVFLIKTEGSNNVQTNTKATVEDVKQEVKNGWNQENGNWYFYKNNEKQTNWAENNKSWYYLGTDGKMRTGWIKDKDQWYYLNSDGTLATNTTIDGYYLNTSGLMEETPSKAKEITKSSETETNTNTNITYKTYTNKRFGFSIDYPSNLIPGTPPANGDGLEFTSTDGVTLVASGGHNALSKTIQQSYSERINQLHVKPTYTHLNNNSYIISWQENGMITYSYSILGTASSNGFSLTYPASEKEYYTDVVDRIYKSFNTPGINTM